MTIKKYIIRISGDKWHYAVVPSEVYDKKYDPTGDAQTFPEKKLIVFRESVFCLTTVIHELVHAYHNKMCLSDTQSIGVADFEEITATFTETFIFDIIQNSMKIFTKYNPENEGVLKELHEVLKKIKGMEG